VIFVCAALLVGLLTLLAFIAFEFESSSSDQWHQQRGHRRTEDKRLSVEISLEEVYNGGHFKISLPVQRTCSHCEGSGADKGAEIHRCPLCGGHGVRIVNQNMGGFMFQQQERCHKCGGSGRVVSKLCPKCHGHQMVQEKADLELVVDKGAIDGQQIVFHEASDHAPGHVPGDVVVVLSTKPHPRFARKGEVDLSTKISISLLQSLVGFSVEIEHLDGHKVTVRKEGVSSPGEIVNLVGEGLPYLKRPYERGTLFVQLEIKFPKQLSPTECEEAKRLLPNMYTESELLTE